MHKDYKSYLVRSWQPRDREAAAELITEVLGEFGLGWDPQGTDQDVLQVEAAYQQTGGEFWVVEAAGAVVGTAGYYPINRGTELGMRAVEIRKMYLATTLRGQGLGRWLLGQLEQRIQEQGYSHIWIETVSRMQAAVHLYESSGYERSGDVWVPRCDRCYVKALL
jgi:putative acetyltransferase